MSEQRMTLRVEPRNLALKERFTIATKSWDQAENVFVRLAWGDAEGIGEVSPEDRKDESVDGVVAQLEALDLSGVASPFALEQLGALLPAGAARCALDIAAHDLAAKTAGVSVIDLLGLRGCSPPPTSVTVPIAPVDEMVARAAALSDHPIIKTKVGFEGDVDALARIRRVYPGKMRIDANEGWEPDSAIAALRELESLDIELCEQPIKAGRLAELKRVTDSTSIPIFADEDVNTAEDVARLAGVVDGVNLKLRKTGGIREALRAIHAARALGLRVMIGCDLESGVAATAEGTVATLVDHCDIDGPLLLADDPFPGVTYHQGYVTLPSGPGLGVTEQ